MIQSRAEKEIRNQKYKRCLDKANLCQWKMGVFIYHIKKRCEMKRKERMGWYIEQICKVLQHLPISQANEIECRALWNNLQLSHEDIVTKYIDKEAK